MSKQGVKLLIGALVLGTVLGTPMDRVSAKTTENGVTYYFPWEHDQFLEDMEKKFAERGMGKSYASYEDYLADQEKNRQSAGQNSPSTKEPAKPKECRHEYDSKVTKEASCAEEGTIEYTCTKCGEKYTEAIEKTNEHIYEETLVRESSCTDEGEKCFTCSVCGDSYTEAIPVADHEYVTEVTVEPGCETAGEEKTYCRNCDDATVRELPAEGHEEGEWTVVTPASLFSEGEQVKNCAVCNKQLESQIIPSRYPVWYLYAGIGAAVGLAVLAVVIIILRRKNEKRNSAENNMIDINKEKEMRNPEPV